MIPADLLSQLREKDPELHSRYINLMTDIDPLVDSDIPFCQLAIMQACLQEAIRARGWWYELSGKSACVAIIGHGITCIAERASQTEAEALCAAYLAALEATE